MIDVFEKLKKHPKAVEYEEDRVRFLKGLSLVDHIGNKRNRKAPSILR